jgi:hypothetical protein
MATLFDTGINKSYDKSELSKLFDTKESFLTSNDVPVLKRQFNGMVNNGKQDPARALTDPAKAKTHYYENHAVVSDFPKSLVGESVAKMWKDGTYNDMEEQANKDREELYAKVNFAPDKDFDLRFNRLDREQNAQAIMANYFAQRAQEKDAERRIYLTEYGLSPAEVEDVLARQRIENAYEGLKSSKRQFSQSGIDSAVSRAVNKIVADRKTAGIPEPTQVVPKEAEVSTTSAVKRKAGIETIKAGTSILERLTSPADIDRLGQSDLQKLLRGAFNATLPSGKQKQLTVAELRDLAKREYGERRPKE